MEWRCIWKGRTNYDETCIKSVTKIYHNWMKIRKIHMIIMSEYKQMAKINNLISHYSNFIYKFITLMSLKILAYTMARVDRLAMEIVKEYNQQRISLTCCDLLLWWAGGSCNTWKQTLLKYWQSHVKTRQLPGGKEGNYERTLVPEEWKLYWCIRGKKKESYMQMKRRGCYMERERWKKASRKVSENSLTLLTWKMLWLYHQFTIVWTIDIRS